MDPPALHQQAVLLPERHSKQNLTPIERKRIVSQLLLKVKKDHPEQCLLRGAITEIANSHNVHRDTIRRIWARARASSQNPELGFLFDAPSQKHKTGRNQKWNRDEVRRAVKALPLHQRRSLRSLGAALAIPKSTLFDMKNDKSDKVIIPTTSVLKPMLTEEHKTQRAFYCVSKLNPADNMFHGFYDSVHIDEKWFFISEEILRCYIASDEPSPSRYTQNKGHILKVMFLCAVARPHYNQDGACIFDGKIGLWPFVESIAARRTSVNRVQGTMVTTPVACTKERYRQLLINHVLPAIKEKWPNRRERRVIIQQDGASSHIPSWDPEFRYHATQGQWNISLETQPAKSPDTNVLDLSFFRALQSAQWGLGCVGNNIDALIAQVRRAFALFEPRKIDFGFLTLQTCLDEILGVHGDNDYTLPHIGKEQMLNAGILPERIAASE